MGGIGTLSADIHEVERFVRVPDTGFLEALHGRHGEIGVDLPVFFLGEPLERLSERPDATVVVGDLGDDLLGVLREIVDDDRFGFFVGI